MLELIKGTPTWVWLLLIFLIYMGSKSLFDRTIEVKKLLIMPIVFLIMTASHIKDPLSYGIFLVLGAIVGFLTCFKYKIRVDREHRLLRIPGTPLPLILIVLVFVKNYFYGYEHAVHPEVFKNIIFLAISYIVSGVFSGIFIGRSGTHFFRYLRLPSEDLSATVESKNKKVK